MLLLVKKYKNLFFLQTLEAEIRQVSLLFIFIDSNSHFLFYSRNYNVFTSLSSKSKSSVDFGSTG